MANGVSGIIFLNGEKVGETDNMLIPHSFDVTKALKPVKNVRHVLIRSTFFEVDFLGTGPKASRQGVRSTPSPEIMV